MEEGWLIKKSTEPNTLAHCYRLLNQIIYFVKVDNWLTETGLQISYFVKVDKIYDSSCGIMAYQLF